MINLKFKMYLYIIVLEREFKKCIINELIVLEEFNVL